MSKYKYDAVIWDYNGTLADDVEASLLASNEIIVRHGKEPITMAQYYDYVDYPISRFWEHVFDLYEFPMAKIGEEYYKAYPKYFRGLSDGAAELVKKLRRAGVVQMILTSAHPRLIGETLREELVGGGGRQRSCGLPQAARFPGNTIGCACPCRRAQYLV